MNIRIGAALICISGCTGKQSAGTVSMDGSSTVYPIAEAVAEAFQARDDGARVTIGVSGTGGGMKKLCAGEVDLVGASRPIKQVESEACAAAGREYVELPIAYDGIAVVVNPAADWIDTITIDELREMWSPEAQGEVTRWNQIRDDWPDRPLHLFGAGVDSGTYDYFTLAVVGTEHASRGDFTSSEDDNVLVQGVATDPGGLGFFGMAYYLENQSRLKALGVKPDPDSAAVWPSQETVTNGEYQPLSRPLFLYALAGSLGQPEVEEFVAFFLNQGSELASEVGYVSLPPSARALVETRLRKRTTGSAFGAAGSRIGVSIEDVLGADE